MKQPVITISREFGSGGREIGEALAEKLGLTLYDKTLIDIVAEKSGYPVEFVAENDQTLTRSMLFQIAVTGSMPPWINKPADQPSRETVFAAQSGVIRDIAAKGGCVIIGRCADYILRDDPDCLTVFITGKRGDMINRCVKEYGLRPEVAVGEMMKRDKERATHYLHYTNQLWGDSKNYDICLNSGVFGIDGCVDFIIDALKKMKKL